MSSYTARIVNVQRFSTEDGPGIRTTVFFKGCPMRCPWCHNPEAMGFAPELVWHAGRCLGDHGCVQACPDTVLVSTECGIAISRDRCKACGACVDFCPAEALELHGHVTPVPDLFDQVSRDVAFYECSGGGVTLSGGEPLAQPDAAISLLRYLKDARIHAALDTCGAAPDRVLNEALQYVDLVLFDVKTVDAAKHEAFTGVPFQRIAAAARHIAESGATVWVRTPIIPEYTDGERGIRDIARFIRKMLPRCERYDLLAFSNLCQSKYDQLDRAFPLAGAPLLTVEDLDRLAELARHEGVANVHWSGPTRTTAHAPAV